MKQKSHAFECIGTDLRPHWFAVVEGVVPMFRVFGHIEICLHKGPGGQMYVGWMGERRCMYANVWTHQFNC